MHLIWPSLFQGLLASGYPFRCEGDLLILMAVFGATISYVLMMMSYIKLQTVSTNLARPYKAPGGIVTASIALVLAAIAVVAGFSARSKSLVNGSSHLCGTNSLFLADIAVIIWWQGTGDNLPY